MSPTVGHIVVGPPHHGVVRYAHTLAAAIGGPVVAAADTQTLRATSIPDVDALHIHFTDRLFGATAATGAAEFVSVAEELDAAVSVTLHDVPQPSDGHAFTMRVDAYRRVIESAEGIVVSSDHERRLLAEFAGVEHGVDVVPLVVDAAPSPPTERPARRAQVGVLGFIYPGKGHAEIIDAVGRIDDELGVLAVGAVAAGHDDLITDLHSQAARADVRFETTGFVPDTDLAEILRSVAVPVAFHRHLSASASINTWIAAGRRPLVPRNRYTAEVEANSPGALWLHGDSADDLRDAIADALTRPELTWVGDDVVTFPTSSQVAAMYRALFLRWSQR